MSVKEVEKKKETVRESEGGGGREYACERQKKERKMRKQMNVFVKEWERKR